MPPYTSTANLSTISYIENMIKLDLYINKIHSENEVLDICCTVRPVWTRSEIIIEVSNHFALFFITQHSINTENI